MGISQSDRGDVQSEQQNHGHQQVQGIMDSKSLQRSRKRSQELMEENVKDY